MIKMLRIDDRLIHGQVAVVWSKNLNVSRIVVVSDSISENEIQKAALKMAAPDNIKAFILPVKKALKLLNDPRSQDLSILVIMNGLTVAAGMLPAVGIALLMITLWDKNLAPWFFLGFGIVAFFEGTMIEVAFIGICIAVLVAVSDLKKHQENKITMQQNGNNDKDVEEDFFND